MQTIPYTPLKDIRIVLGIYLAPRTGRTGGMLAKKFNMLLGNVPRFFDVFGVFGRPT